jgi:hypothetical protein
MSGCILLISSFPPDLYITKDTFANVIDVSKEAKALIATIMTRKERASAVTAEYMKTEQEKFENDQKQHEKNLLYQFCSRYTPNFLSNRPYATQKFRPYKTDLLDVLKHLVIIHKQAFKKHHIRTYFPESKITVPELKAIVKQVAADVLHVAWANGFPAQHDGYMVEEPDNTQQSSQSTTTVDTNTANMQPAIEFPSGDGWYQLLSQYCVSLPVYADIRNQQNH